ncbi:zinc ribbon domain-containing protein [Peribacillus asahii]|uniref:zinc ribbon domain-containing protein n=1 Tax=Peribacillus asahii TaxID=228899 RepID=UPI0038054B17
MQREAASVWNDIVREATSYYFACKKWLSKTEIQAIRKQNKVRRQQLSLWNQGKIKQKLTYKAKIKGIIVTETEESYTSQDCPFCGGRHGANGRTFICSVHKTEIHRDVNGAQNIARKHHHMAV